MSTTIISMTVEEMLYKWIPIQSTKHKWSPKTYTQSVAMVQNLIVPYIGNRKVQELRTYDIEKFYATLAHTQNKPRLELAEKIEANFYTQDLTPAAPQPRQNEKPAATKISGKEILEAIRLMDADERRELTRALFA